MIIRPESEKDYPAIRNFLLPLSQIIPIAIRPSICIVEALRTSNALTLALVAEADGNVVGHIAFSPAEVNGVDCLWFTLGPIAVMPEFQRRGIGTRLVEEGLKALRDRRPGLCFGGRSGFLRPFWLSAKPGVVDGRGSAPVSLVPADGRANPPGSGVASSRIFRLRTIRRVFVDVKFPV